MSSKNKKVFTPLFFFSATFCNDVHTWRRAKGLSLRQAAKTAKVSAPTISRVENGHKFDVKTFVKLLNFIEGDINTYIN